MKIGKRGKDLAVRIPIAVVRALGLKAGDEVTLWAVGPMDFVIERAGPPEQAPEAAR